MDLHITLHRRGNLTDQLYRALRARILDGQLATGQRLPSSRDLAAQLGVSRKTTTEAFERLASEGFLYARPGSGTFVANAMARLPATSSTRTNTRARASSVWDTLPDPVAMPRPNRSKPLDFAGGVTDMSCFPVAAWRRSINHALRMQMRDVSGYREPKGDQTLRLAIARYLAFSRALDAGWQDIVVTQGAQQALDLMARVIIRPGDIVAVEDPCYPPARSSFVAAGAQLAPTPIDDQGIIVEQLPARARLVYVTPSHQFPLGMPMSVERRLALLKWARQHDAIIIEDDYDGEFRFEGRPLEPLKSLDRTGLVAYIGTFSKTIFPELRVGYLVPPPSLAGALHKAKQLADWHGCTLTQSALAHFMSAGDFAKHLRRVHKLYTARRQVLLSHLHGKLAPWFYPSLQAAGIHLCARLRQPQSEKIVIDAARQASIALYGISGMYIQATPDPGLLFGYGNISAENIDVAMEKLARILPHTLD